MMWFEAPQSFFRCGDSNRNKQDYEDSIGFLLSSSNLSKVPFLRFEVLYACSASLTGPRLIAIEPWIAGF